MTLTLDDIDAKLDLVLTAIAAAQDDIKKVKTQVKKIDDDQTETKKETKHNPKNTTPR
jgi:hypothetical protein